MGARRLERGCFCFFMLKNRKDGESRMAKLKWLDEYCNECGNQLGRGEVLKLGKHCFPNLII